MASLAAETSSRKAGPRRSLDSSTKKKLANMKVSPNSGRGRRTSAPALIPETPGLRNSLNKSLGMDPGMLSENIDLLRSQSQPINTEGAADDGSSNPQKNQLANQLLDQLERRCNDNTDGMGMISKKELDFIRQAYAIAMSRDNSVSLEKKANDRLFDRIKEMQTEISTNAEETFVDSSGVLEQSGTLEKKEKQSPDENKGSGKLSSSVPMAAILAASKWRSSARRRTMRKKLTEYLSQPEKEHDAVLGEVLRNISTWNFDVFEVAKLAPNAPLVFIGYMMFMSSNLSATFRISDAKLLAFLTEVDRGYLQNPYHNRLHGTDVAHSMHHLLSSGGLSRHMTNWQHLAALTSALCHDLGHFGLTNPFLTETQHEVALTYFNRSPLESMHISKLFQILSKEECDIFEMLTGDVSKLVRNLMVDMILATDMAVHGLHLAEFENMIEASDAPDMSDPATSKLILQVALHAVDISNPAKEWDYYIKWTDRVLTEFHAQGDQERDLGLPISPGFDRTKMTTIKNKAAGQMFFIGVLVKPLYEAFHKLSYVNLDEPVHNIETNLGRWKKIIDEFDREELRREKAAAVNDAKDAGGTNDG